MNKSRKVHQITLTPSTMIALPHKRPLRIAPILSRPNSSAAGPSSPMDAQITLTAILAAIIVLLAFTPLGYLRIGLVSITFLTVPVVVGGRSCWTASPLWTSAQTPPPSLPLPGAERGTIHPRLPR